MARKSTPKVEEIRMTGFPIRVPAQLKLDFEEEGVRRGMAASTLARWVLAEWMKAHKGGK